MNKEDKILKLLEKQDSTMKMMFSKQDAKIDKMTLAILDIKEDVSSIKDQLPSFVTKDEYLISHDQIAQSLLRLEVGQAASVSRDDRMVKKLDNLIEDYDSSTEQMVTILMRLDGGQESIETKVDKHEIEVKSIKTHLKMA